MSMLQLNPTTSQRCQTVARWGRFAFLIVTPILSVMLVGCSRAPDVFDEGKVYEVTSGQTIKLESEQVSLRPEDVNCGVDNDLFDPPTAVASRTVAHLTQKGRDLGFSDDVTVSEAGYNLPYTQVRGIFPVEFRKVVGIRDVSQGEKTVEALAGIRINHSCFAAPLTIMGVRHGAIDQKAPAAFAFAMNNGNWQLDHILHQ
jgi:hypothetical protein